MCNFKKMTSMELLILFKNNLILLTVEIFFLEFNSQSLTCTELKIGTNSISFPIVEAMKTVLWMFSIVPFFPIVINERYWKCLRRFVRVFYANFNTGRAWPTLNGVRTNFERVKTYLNLLKRFVISSTLV